MTDKTHSLDLPVALVGASAGGLPAIQAFLAAIPSDSHIAYIVIQHSSANSQLASILEKDSPLPVVEVENGDTLQAGHVYVIPGQMNAAFQDNTIHLHSNLSANQMRHPIDYSLRSLAHSQREKIAAVILSGTDADGSLGIRAVKEASGLVIAQTPETAEFDQMPYSAIASGFVDYVLPPEEMPEKISDFVTNMIMVDTDGLADTDTEVDELLTQIFVLLQSSSGHDFSQYKKKTVIRRIQRRMVLYQAADLQAYVSLLQQHPEEVQTLFKELLIGVTAFFRDKEAFERLETTIIPELFEPHKRDSIVRVWCIGCSTGEEAYSLAILLQEYADTLPDAYRIQIFATDIDERAIQYARNAHYPINIAADVTPERLNRFFTEENGMYVVRKHIRDRVTFAVQNIIKDPPFSKLDLVTCRNLLIYLETELQERLIPLFHYILNPDGYLFLGTSETLRGYSHLFDAVDKKWKLFQRTTDAAQVRLSFGLATTRTPRNMELKKTNMQAPKSLKLMIETVILEDFTRPCAIVDARGDIIYLHQRTDKYLEPAIGEATNNILRMAREGLRLPLTTALSRIHNGDGDITYRHLRVQKNGGYVLVNLLVSQLLHPPTLRGYILIMFEDIVGSDRAESETISTNMDELTAKHVIELEQELASTKEYLQAVVEELEASNEELKSMNEELHASNEEMQSTNEELETASEELQSVNEELQTANSELENKIEELDESSRQLSDLLNNVDLGIIFLDRQLRIIRFTQFAKRVMNLIASDIGRPLSDLAFKLDGIELAEHAQEVLNTLSSQRLEVHTPGDVWHWITLKPYRTTNDAIVGVVITFIDITELGRSQQRSENIAEDVAQASYASDSLMLLHSMSYEWQRFTMQQHPTDDLIHEFCRLLTNIPDIQTAMVYLPDSVKTSFAAGIDADTAQALMESFIHHENRPEAQAIASGEIVVAGDLIANASFDSVRKLIAAQKYKSLVAVPISADQRIIGLVVIYCSVQRLFAEQETQLLQLMTDHLGSLLTLI